MTGKFEAYVLWPLAKRVQNRIIEQSTAWDFTVFLTNIKSVNQLTYPKLTAIPIIAMNETKSQGVKKPDFFSIRPRHNFTWIITIEYRIPSTKVAGYWHKSYRK